MTDTRFEKAMRETIEYLRGIREEDLMKIPMSFLKFMAKHASKDYICTFDYRKPLNELEYDLMNETKGIICFICYNFWCENDAERKEIMDTLNANEIKFQDELKKKYNTDVFGNKPKKVKKSKNEANIKTTEDKGLIVRDESFFKKILNKIFDLIRKIQKGDY